MPVPKKRHSNTRTNKRRATWKIHPVTIGKCPQCGSPVLPHNACRNCGTYQGRAVLKIEAVEEKRKKKEAKAQKETAKQTEKESSGTGPAAEEGKKSKKEKK
jgi:large subunit ribosomal protein L32